MNGEIKTKNKLKTKTKKVPNWLKVVMLIFQK